MTAKFLADRGVEDRARSRGHAGSTREIEQRLLFRTRIERGQHDDIQIDRAAGMFLAVFKDGELSALQLFLYAGQSAGSEATACEPVFFMTSRETNRD